MINTLSPSPFVLKDFMLQSQQRIHTALRDHLEALPARAIGLRSAMQYASLQGGKRVRPLLVYAAAQALVLVRPDGYVMGRWRGLDPAPLVAVLEQKGFAA